MKRILLILTLCSLGIPSIYSQDNVGIGTVTPKVKALLDLTSSEKGLLVPRMSSAQRNAINPGLNDYYGLLVYDLTLNAYHMWDGTVWVPMEDFTPLNELDSLAWDNATYMLSIVNGPHNITVDLSGLVDADDDSTNENQTLSINATLDSLLISNGNSVPFITVDMDSQMLSLSNDTIFITNGNFVVLPSDSIIDDDADSTNELQSLFLNAAMDSIFITNGNGIPVIDTDSQSLSINLDTIFISRGNFVILPADSVIDDDADSTNELQTLFLNGAMDTLFISGNNSGVPFFGTDNQTLILNATLDSVMITNGNTIPIATVDTDSQSLNLNLDTLFITRGNFVVLPILGDDDADSTNEIQTLSINGTMDSITISGGNTIGIPASADSQSLSLNLDTLFITRGNFVVLPIVGDDDADSTNEIQTLSINATMDSITISGGNTIEIPSGVDTDSQSLSLSVDTLFITRGNFVVLPIVGDDDADSTNELQTLTLVPTGDSIMISGGNTIAAPQDLDWTVAGADMYNNNFGNVGIGVMVPQAGLHLLSANGFLAEGAFGGGPTIPVAGAGTRMFFDPSSGAFRAGAVAANQWDAANVSNFSAALGLNTVADGNAAFAVGDSSVSRGNASIAMGNRNQSTGIQSFAGGAFSRSTGDQSFAYGLAAEALDWWTIAMGTAARATNLNAIAIGPNASSSGDGSIALGNFATATGASSVAIGNNTTSDGNFSFVAGSNADANGFFGCNVFGDQSLGFGDVQASANNQFVARASGGYQLWTNQAKTFGAELLPGATMWSILSDKNLKEGFKDIDGEDMLNKIAQMRLTTWNYIGQDAATMRHYGPMAQDFYAAFGDDGIGTIGSDTKIATGDLMGVNLSAIHALEKRTRDQAEMIERQQQQIEALRRSLDSAVGQIQELEVYIKKGSETKVRSSVLGE